MTPANPRRHSRRLRVGAAGLGIASAVSAVLGLNPTASASAAATTPTSSSTSSTTSSRDAGSVALRVGTWGTAQAPGPVGPPGAGRAHATTSGS